MCTSVQTTAGDMNRTNLKGVMKNQDIKGVFLKISSIFMYKCFS